MTDQWTERLSEYLDNELTHAERQQLEGHLETCAPCSAVLMELKSVALRAGRLEDREPGADLWPGIREAIGSKVIALDTRRTPARRFSFSVPQLVAAAAALVLMSGGTAWWMSNPPGRPTDSATQLVEVAAQTVSFDRKGRADSAIIELERILQQESSQLDTSTVRILTQNLALIDRAIGQARKALDSDPNNPYLNDHLARTMRKKIEVLRRAADLAQAAS